MKNRMLVLKKQYPINFIFFIFTFEHKQSTPISINSVMDLNGLMVKLFNIGKSSENQVFGNIKKKNFDALNPRVKY